ncbi:tRNA (guanine(9)-N1)-methyltransferase [Asparagus officinalis]|uniref:tRNA (guanine(9)-N(1))-methyltransferase n=1 Tax=Asparagus officinalis TaxID=4686 RepID=A0A5P1EZ01_ASPOF|nr:tRNA (guanine(9)-N1)-methyltransferase [Asparagus officinalis]ONK69380.1 tRNA (guanine(9)-N1)-methyltransferase [Asparagus officinalis]
MEEPNQNDQPTLSKSARKKLAKQQRQAERKAERKSQEKERKRKDLERRRREWEEKLSSAASEEERTRMIEERKETRKERMGKRAEERGMRAERLKKAKEIGQKVVIDLEFAELMTSNEIHSLVQQVMYCYAVNGRCASPAHLWLTGCTGEMETQLQKIPGFDKWIIEKEAKSYIEALQDQKENLVYLTADAETVLNELDPMKIYIIGGLVDRNRWKGITMKKANEQGIQSARLPIGNYLKMSSSQVLTVNQVVEILLKFLQTRDWKDAFFQVIPQRKRDEGKGDAETEETGDENAEDPAELVAADEDALEVEGADNLEIEEDADDDQDIDPFVKKKQRLEKSDNDAGRAIEEETNGMRNESQ